MLPQITNVKPPVNLTSAHLFTRASLADVLPAEYIARQAARRAAQLRARIMATATYPSLLK